MVTIGGLSFLATGGHLNGSTVSSTTAAIGSILAEHLEPRLGLYRLARLGAEAVDEGLEMRAPLVLLLGGLADQGLLLSPLALKARVAAAPQRKLSPVEVQDVVGDLVEQVAVVADDEDGRSAAPQVVGEPQHSLEVEVVGRLVEKQDVRF